MEDFKKHGSISKLRRDFINLRRQHLERCLIAYSSDLRETCYYTSAASVVGLLDIKLRFYVERFEKDLNLLFEKDWRNRFTVFRFKKAGDEIINHLVIVI